ncbi:MAG: S-layer homology domain-containing protein [Bacillota bacterium]
MKKFLDGLEKWLPSIIIAFIFAVGGGFLASAGLTKLDDIRKANIVANTHGGESKEEETKEKVVAKETETKTETELVDEEKEIVPTKMESTELSEFRRVLEELVDIEVILENRASIPDYQKMEEALQNDEKTVHIFPGSPDMEVLEENDGTFVDFFEYEIDGGEDGNPRTTNERQFLVMSGNNVMTVASATLEAVGSNCNVWVVSPDQAYDDRNAGDITSQLAEEIAENTDAIYGKMTKAFAPHANILIGNTLYGTVGDVDNDGKINVLLYDIASDGGVGDVFFGGYFASTDMAGYQSVGVMPVDAIHMDIGIDQGFSKNNTGVAEEFYGTIAHEFQHMLYYTYFGAHTPFFVTEDDLWFNESLSGLTDVYYSSPDGNATVQNLSSSRVIMGNSNDYSGARGYGDFVSFSDSLKNYGIGYMFASFMQEINPVYANRVYDYFIKNLTDGGRLSSVSAQKFYADKEMPNIIGQALRYGFDSDHALADGIAQLSDAEVFEYFYTAFMESYISDGGNVIDGEEVHATIPFWHDGNLWDYKNYGGYSQYSTLQSSDVVRLEGYGANQASGAVHEMTYALQNQYTAKTPNIHITVGERGDVFSAYLVLYNADQRNADIYPLTLGEEAVINTENKPVYLFVTTFYGDVSARVSYYWATETGTAQNNEIPVVERFLANYEQVPLSETIINDNNSEDSALGRAEFVTLLGELAEINTAPYSNLTYNDVEATSEYAPYIAWATTENIANGISSTRFAPEDEVTREQVAYMLLKFSNYMNLQFLKGESQFDDQEDISPYASEAVYAMSQLDLMTAKEGNEFQPNSIVTRGELCEILEGYVEVLGKAIGIIDIEPEAEAETAAETEPTEAEIREAIREAARADARIGTGTETGTITETETSQSIADIEAVAGTLSDLVLGTSSDGASDILSDILMETLGQSLSFD